MMYALRLIPAASAAAVIVSRVGSVSFLILSKTLSYAFCSKRRVAALCAVLCAIVYIIYYKAVTRYRDLAQNASVLFVQHSEIDRSLASVL